MKSNVMMKYETGIYIYLIITEDSSENMPIVHNEDQ